MLPSNIAFLQHRAPTGTRLTAPRWRSGRSMDMSKESPVKTIVSTLSLALLTAAAAHAQAPAGRPDPHIDRIFAPWDHADTPGCALAVVRNGALAYARGYGSANLEQGLPITRHTVFDIGSVSKQFTALSIVLLAQDGKLSLDDDVRRYVPELPDYGTPVSLRRMLHHQSGLPSYTDLFDLAGVPEADLTTDDDALALIARQRTLNFPPGRQYLYSDTNYFLLALVVQRVSGQSLRAFAQRRIFAPLGMRDTHFHDDHGLIVPHRATGYAPRTDGGYAIDMSNFEELGDGSVMTTVDDMVRWDRNFRDPVVGGRSAIVQLEEAGVRTDGSVAPYAMGQIRDSYRGHGRIQHTGEWVGYRSGYLRFPQDGLSVILLCNSIGELDTLALGERVADRYLGAGGAGDGAAASAPAAAYAGLYWNARTLAVLHFAAAGNALALVDADGAQQLQDLGGGRFAAGNSSTRYVFHDEPGHARVQAFSDDGDPLELERIDAGAARAAPADPADYAGSYYSEELGVSWILSVRDGQLLRHQWLFPAQRLVPQFGEVYRGDLSEGSYTLQFSRDAGGAVDGFAVATTMVHPQRFRRCTPAAAGATTPIAQACGAR
jgi:CubicO group peptidase (beta-lactamase class C family)